MDIKETNETDFNAELETTRKDFEILKEISSSVIHENADLKNEIDEKERELNLLYKVMQEISYSMDWNEIQVSTLDIIIDFFSVLYLVMIAVYDTSTNSIRVRIRTRNKEILESDNVKFGFNINDTTTWDEVVASTEWNERFHNFTNELNLQTSFIPLKLKSREVGFLMVGKPAEAKYGKGEWRFLRTLSNHLAVTLENAELYRLATTDTLTQLFNRRYFTDRLARELDRAYMRGENLSLLMIDIDRFKQINDNFGHQSGDQVLIELSSRLRKVVQNNGTVCRFGGEEFTVILPHTDSRIATGIAEDIRWTVGATPFEFTSDSETVEKNLTISAGISTYPADALDSESLISKSDQALYLAKASGRNKVIVFKADLQG